MYSKKNSSIITQFTLLIIHIRYEIFLQSLKNILMSDHNSTALLSDMEFSSGGN